MPHPTVEIYKQTADINHQDDRCAKGAQRRNPERGPDHADLAPKEMAASDMRNRRHVQPLLTWSTNAAHPVSLD
ncbi:hypothetical protein LAZ67_4001540 [Cordylochernes scorpioides]|uniref:Uncharacterized protein n=1 Tax=Cordylochernes scorpioides TaxID=51811 RepID=A0ABY6KFG1_9ARAC|nr:hypothetical protein LAZ67_4001540 [Cordylochernes scorpioides]